MKIFLCHKMADSDDSFFEVKRNVRTVTVDINTSIRNCSFYKDSLDDNHNNDRQIFYIMETPYHDAFAHWVYETAIYLHLFKFDGKIVIKSTPERTYKKLFLNLYDISDEYIHWTDSDVIPEFNVCKILKSFCLNDTNPDNLLTFRSLINKFCLFLTRNVEYNKVIHHLFFPRNNLQNYAANDRTMNYQKFYQHIEGLKYEEYDTMKTRDFRDQIDLLASATSIYLDYGSSFLVNGLCCKYSKIYITGKSDQHCLYPLLGEIFKYIQTLNNVIFLD